MTGWLECSNTNEPVIMTENCSSELMKTDPVFLYDDQDDNVRDHSKYNLLAVQLLTVKTFCRGMVVVDDVIEGC